ncbi:hypothetical protein J2R99_002672 [Rhodopseudomonas julia]|uniref:Flagellar biosynthesis protein FliO n=1 Tax=Rhodopseudomonas julia TaxID=200617 RepID=A0ABU0C8E7_9BRAD|nr:flagellar biosynthetic protein FliO [Rhodopseudomonas julia]MDQ0326803.1 hypothetical protein [Rhodopseudomonas julia]
MRGLTDLSTGAFAGPILLAIAVLLVILGLVVWITRRGIVPGRGAAAQRVSRLQVMETHAIDQKRRLLLIRRDQVEHLVMIGGPADIVVESQIVRGRPTAQPAPRRPANPPATPQMPGFPTTHRPPEPAGGEYPQSTSSSQPMGQLAGQPTGQPVAQNIRPPAEQHAPSPAIGRATGDGPAHGVGYTGPLAPPPSASRPEAAEADKEPPRAKRAVPEAYRFGMDEDDVPASSPAETSKTVPDEKREPLHEASDARDREIRNAPAQDPAANASKEQTKATQETPFGDMPPALRARMLSGLFSPAPKPGQPVPEETPDVQAPSNTLPFAKRLVPQQDKDTADGSHAVPEPEAVPTRPESAAIEKATVSFFQNIRRVSKENTEEIAPPKAPSSQPDTRSLEEEIGEAFGELAAQRGEAADARRGGADRSALSVPPALNEDKGEARTTASHVTWPTVSIAREKHADAPVGVSDVQIERDERPQPTTIAEIASQLESALSERLTERHPARDRGTGGAQPEGPDVSPAKPETVSKAESHGDEIAATARAPEIHPEDAHGANERLEPDAPAIASTPLTAPSEMRDGDDIVSDEAQRERRSTANLESDESASVVAFEPKRKWASEQEQLEDEMARLLGELTGDLKNR